MGETLSRRLGAYLPVHPSSLADLELGLVSTDLRRGQAAGRLHRESDIAVAVLMNRERYRGGRSGSMPACA